MIVSQFEQARHWRDHFLCLPSTKWSQCGAYKLVSGEESLLVKSDGWFLVGWCYLLSQVDAGSYICTGGRCSCGLGGNHFQAPVH